MNSNNDLIILYKKMTEFNSLPQKDPSRAESRRDAFLNEIIYETIFISKKELGSRKAGKV